jgi:hypothetical protein
MSLGLLQMNAVSEEAEQVQRGVLSPLYLEPKPRRSEDFYGIFCSFNNKACNFEITVLG